MSPRYERCRTCGRWTLRARLSNEGRCSLACSQKFSICATCGRAFPQGQGFDDERYLIVRNYGPRPVTLATEE
jgi:uncharacterized protein with PIN domain